MGVYGPNQASLNAVVTVSGLDPNADRLYIDNRSIYELAIAFGDQAPSAVATLNGMPWLDVVPPGGKTLRIPLDQFGGNHFNGKVYVMALNPIAGQLAASGRISTNTAFFVRTLVPGEVPPNDYTIPQWSNAASQQRVVTVPFTLGDIGSNVLPTRIGTPAAGARVNIANLGQLSTTPGQGENFYLYYILATPGFTTTGAGGMDLLIEFDLQTAANVSMGFPFPIQLIQISLFWTGAAGPFSSLDWSRPWPITYPFSLGYANLDHAALVFHNNGSTAAPAQFDVTIGWAFGNPGVTIPAPPGPIESPGQLAGVVF